MSAALSSELRTRFRSYIEEGFSRRRAAAARLKLSAATGVRWQRKLREKGSVAPDVQGRPPGHGKLATHRGFIEELVAQDGDITLPELAGALEAATGVVAHSASIHCPAGDCEAICREGDGSCASLDTLIKKVTGRD